MKNLVVQVFFDKSLIGNHKKLKDDGTRGSMLTANNLNMELYQHSQILAKRYAERVGADYVLFDEPYIDFLNPMFERYRLVFEEKWEEEYDNILYLDCDAFIYDDCPNLFEIYPQQSLRVVRDLNPAIRYTEKKIVSEFGWDYIKDYYFNSGVLLFDKSSLKQLRTALEGFRDRFDEFPFGDQSEINYAVFKHDLPLIVMDDRFNSFHKDALIAHLYGPQKISNKYHLNKAKKQAMGSVLDVKTRKFDITSVPAYYINVDYEPGKVTRTEKTLRDFGYKDVTRVEGVRSRIKKVGCSGSHFKVLDNPEIKTPFLLAEDDILPMGIEKLIYDLPEDADALYIGTNQWGRYLSFMGPFVHYGEVSSDIVRIYNMLSAHAIIYISEEYRQHARRIARCSHVEKGYHIDVGFADAQKFYNIYALDTPAFHQAGGNAPTTKVTLSKVGVEISESQQFFDAVKFDLNKLNGVVDIGGQYKSWYYPIAYGGVGIDFTTPHPKYRD